MCQGLRERPVPELGPGASHQSEDRLCKSLSLSVYAQHVSSSSTFTHSLFIEFCLYKQ